MVRNVLELQTIEEQKKQEKLLLSAGAKKLSPFVFVFPGVNPKDVEKTKSSPIKLPKAPVLKVGSINNFGEMSLDFDQDMLYPSQIDQDFYNNVIQLRFIKANDQEVEFIGRFQNITARALE